VTVSAWIGTMPLTAYFFNLFSPVALGMNLLVIPAAFVILLAGVMSLLCAPFGSFCPEVFNHAARAVASFLTACIEWAAAVPGGHWFVRTPPAGGVVVWYVVLAAATVMARRVRGALAAGFLLLAALALGWGAREARRCRVAVLDVGEGAAALVQARSARVLVDTGPAFHAEETLRQLRGEGVNRLEALVLTHADARHVGAAAWLMQQVPVRELWVPAVLWPSPVVREILRAADAAGVPIRRLHAGASGSLPGGVGWEVLWPPAELDIACADDAALAMRVARYGASVLLAGDLGGRQEETLADRGGSVAAAVLVAGRHGAADATSAAWLDAVRPKDVVISAGPHSEGRHPDDDTLARLAARGVRIWRTDRMGPIAVEFGEGPARWPEDGYRIHELR
jgi:competence protein ComEC